MTLERLSDLETPRLLHSFGWSTLGGILIAGSSFALGIILGRILGPRPFGLVAAAMLPIGFGQLLLDQGMSAELIQKPSLRTEDLKRAFRRQLMVGSILSATLAFGSSALAHWYRMPELVPVVLALSPLFLIQAFGQVPAALLRRHMRFQRLQGIQVVSYLFGYLVLGVPLAVKGFGAWSLVAAQLAQVLLLVPLLLFLTPRAHDHFLLGPTALPRAEHAFAWRVMGANIANWAQSNLAGIIIGRQCGPIDLGLLNRAQSLAQTPLGILTTSLQVVLFPAAAASQNDIPRLREMYLKAARSLAWIAFPVAGLGISWSRPIMEGIYGSAWADAAPILRPLFVALPFVALMSLPGPVLLGLGIASVELRIQVILGIITLVTLIALGRHGVLWMVWSMALIQIVRWAWMTHALSCRVNLSAATLCSHLGYPLLGGTSASIAGWALDWKFNRLHFGVLARLVAEAGCAAVCVMVVLAVYHQAKMRRVAGAMLRGLRS